MKLYAMAVVVAALLGAAAVAAHPWSAQGGEHGHGSRSASGSTAIAVPAAYNFEDGAPASP